MARRRGSDADNPKGGKLDPAEGVYRRRMKNSHSVLFCTGKKREGGDRGSNDGTVHSGRDGEGPVFLRKPKESGRRGSCKRFRIQEE